ncbi:hypothetical protein BDD12DRAFT_875867 [Trichophaea hybrida]|nr:hypothetical protein BDD12DRAFT_875867 [Trichophaea hybrida]
MAGSWWNYFNLFPSLSNPPKPSSFQTSLSSSSTEGGESLSVDDPRLNTANLCPSERTIQTQGGIQAASEPRDQSSGVSISECTPEEVFHDIDDSQLQGQVETAKADLCLSERTLRTQGGTEVATEPLDQYSGVSVSGCTPEEAFYDPDNLQLQSLVETAEGTIDATKLDRDVDADLQATSRTGILSVTQTQGQTHFPRLDYNYNQEIPVITSPETAPEQVSDNPVDASRYGETLTTNMLEPLPDTNENFDTETEEDIWKDLPTLCGGFRTWGNQQKTDLRIRDILHSILHPVAESEQDGIHWRDYNSKWFGVSSEREVASLSTTNRHRELTIDADCELSFLRYPSLISFIGETGAGKSTLISALVKIKSILERKRPIKTPVVGNY